MKYYAIIVAGGSGSRMKSDVPKQFMLLAGKPVLMHTISSFYASAYQPEIIVVLHTGYHTYWTDLCNAHNFIIPHTLVPGGSERFYSVKNALNLISDHAIVAIHDAVRPCVSNQLIDSAYQLAEQAGNAVAAVKSKDSVRQTTSYGSINLKRDEIYLVQTPQTFQSELLLKAYGQEFTSEFTDDASVVEKSGVQINLIQGEPGNLKITFPEDIRIAEFYLGDNR